MSKAVWMLVLAGISAIGTGCGAARKARQVRKVEATRVADSTAAARRAQVAGVDTGHAAPSADTIETAALDPSKATVPAYFLSLHGRPTLFQTFSGKARMEYESGDKSQDFTATFRIRRDSAIWISVVAVGGLVPVARILITPDSVLYINYLVREASRLGIADAAGLLPLPARFSQLQSLLLGDVLEPAAAILSTGKTEGQPVYYVSTNTPSAAYTAYYSASDSTLIGEEMLTADRAVSTAIRYASYGPAGAQKFAAEREIAIDVADTGGAVRHVLRMVFTDPPRFDVPLEFSFSIPKNYTLK